MSTTIDNKVVEMKFDNSNFEKNVSTTISTLDKLKAALHFDGASKGLDDVNKASENNKISKLGEAAEEVSKKFSVLETIATGALYRIGSQAVSAGERMIKSIAFDQINAGFEKYGQKTQAMQTIMAATGKSAEEVNEQMAKLLWFADETSYSFTDMTTNIGKFTSNGVELETAVTAMEGISTWAAISGQNAEAAGRAMYNLSQAIGVGSVKLQDWKSIENANMATQEFKQTVIDTAVEMGILTKVTKNGEDKYYKYGKAIEKNEVSVKNFSSTLKDGWFTADLLNKTLGKYGEYSDGLHEVYETLADLGPEYSKTTSEIIADMKKLKNADDDTILSKGYTKDLIPLVRELAKESDNLGAKAFAAAQEALTFSQAIDATKDAVSSQWMQTFEYIFGGIGTARKMWTDLANELWDIFAAGGENRNIFLRYLNQKGALSDFRESAFRILKDVFRMITLVKESFANIFPGPAADRVVEMIRRFDRFTRSIEITDNVIDALNGDYAHLSYNEQKVYNVLVKLRSAFEGILSVMKIFTTLMTSVLRIIFAIAKEVFPAFSGSALDAAASMGELLKCFSDVVIGKIEQWTDAIIEFIHSFKEFPIVKQAIQFINELVEGFRDGLSEFQNITIDFIQAFRDFTDVMGEYFSPSDAKKDALALRGLKTLQGYLYEFTKSEKVVDVANKIQNKLQDLKKSLAEFKMPNVKDGIFTFLSKIAEGFGSGGLLGGLKNSLNYIKSIFSTKFIKIKDSFLIQLYEIGQKLGPLMSKAFDYLIVAFKGLRKFIFGTRDITVENITEIASKIVGLMILIKALNILDGISDMFEGLADSLENITKAAKWDALANVLKSIAFVLVAIAASLAILGMIEPGKLWEGVKILSVMGIIIAALIVALSKLTGSVKGKFTGGFSDALSIVSLAMVISSIASAMLKLVKAVKELGAMSKGELKKGIESLVAVMLSLTVAIAIIGKACRGASVLSTGVILAFMLGLQKVLGLIAEYDEFFRKGDYSVGLKKLYELMLVLALSIRLMSTKIGKDQKAVSNCFAIIGFVLALKLMLKGVEELGQMPMNQMIQGLIGVTVLIGLLTGSLVAISLSNKGGILEKGQRAVNQFKGLAGALVAMCLAIFVLGTMDIKTLMQGYLAASAVLLMLGLFTKISSEAAGVKTKNLIILFVGLFAVIVTLNYVVKSMASIGADNAIKILLGMAAIFVAMGVFMKSMETIKNLRIQGMSKIIAIMVGMTAVIAALGLILGMMAAMNVDGNQAIGQMTAIGIMLLAMTGVIKILSTMPNMNKTETKKLWKLIPLLAVIGIVAAGLALVIKELQALNINGGEAITQVIALSILMGALGGVLAICVSLTKFKASTSQILGVVGCLAAVGVVAAAAIGILKLLEFVDATGSAPKIVALGAILLEMVAVLTACVLLSKFNANLGEVAGVEFLLVFIGGVVLEAIGLLAILNKVEVNGAVAKITALAGILTAMVAVLAACVVIGKLGPSIGGTGGAIVGLVAIGLVVAEVALIMKLVEGVDGTNAIAQAAAITIFLGSMTAILAILTLMRVDIVSAIDAAMALGTFVDVLAIFLAALGGIFKLIPVDVLETAVEVLGLIGEAIGKFVGGIIGGIVEGALDAIANSLPRLGDGLGQFWENAKPFFDGISKVPSEVFGNMGKLALAIIALTVAELIDGIAGWIGGSGSSIGDLGSDLTAFWRNGQPFFKGISTLSSNTIEMAKMVADMILVLTAAQLLDNITSFLGIFTGGKSFADFGKELAGFGAELGNFSNYVASVNADHIISLVPAIKALIEMSGDIENSGGLAGLIMGDNQWSDLGEGLSGFGNALNAFGRMAKDTVSNGYDVAIQKLEPAIKSLIEIAQDIPNAGGYLAQITGDNTWRELGSGLTDFADILAIFGGKCKTMIGAGYDKDIQGIKPAVDALVEIAQNIPNAGGYLAELVGDNTWKELGAGLTDFGVALNAFGNSVAGTNAGAIEAILPTIEKLSETAEKLPNFGGIFADFFGEGNWTTFSTDLANVGTAIAEFAKATSDTNIVRNVDLGIQALEKLKNISDVAIDEDELLQNGESFRLFAADFRTASNYLTTDAIDLLPKFALNMSILVDALSKISNIDVDDIENFGAALSKLGSESISTLSDSILENGANVVTSFTSIFTDTIKQLTTKAAEFKLIGETTISKISEGIRSQVSNIVDAAKSNAASANAAFRSKYTDFYKSGIYLVEGFIVGLRSKINDAATAAANMAKAATNAAKTNLDINSPSKVFEQIGKYVGEGFVRGMADYESNSARAGMSMVMKAVDAANRVIDDNMDNSPVIRPVLDLNNVERDIAKLNDITGAVDNLTLGVTNDMAIQASNGFNANRVNSFNQTQDQMDMLRNAISALSDNDTEMTVNNTFNISGDNPRAIADEVSRVLQMQVERRGAVWA